MQAVAVSLCGQQIAAWTGPPDASHFGVEQPALATLVRSGSAVVLHQLAAEDLSLSVQAAEAADLEDASTIKQVVVA